jgi:hypothetical protein
MIEKYAGVSNVEKTEVKKMILVTGDPICDHNYYKGNRQTADAPMELLGFRFYRTGGGALLLKKLIAETMNADGWMTEFGMDSNFQALPLSYHAFCFWEPRQLDSGNVKAEYWRTVEPPLGYGQHDDEIAAMAGFKLRDDAYTPRSKPLSQVPDIIVIDDAGIGFRDELRRDLWPSVKAGRNGKCPEWIVLKMTGPIGESPLWNELMKSCSKKLVVIVPAEELRRREVRLSRGLSWEATAEDLVVELHHNPQLTPLLKARYLIVTFQSDGAFWLDNTPGGEKSLLVFDAVRAEGEWSESQGEGGAFGYLSCFTAAIVHELCVPSKEIKVNQTNANPEGETKFVPDIEVALSVGLGASRGLRRIGHGEVKSEDNNNRPGFPFDLIVKMIRESDAKFVSAVIPPSIKERGKWMMLDEWQVNARNTNKARPHYDAALAVAALGPEALERFPVAQFGKYQTVDRKEIESLRTIRQLIVNYVKDKRPKAPLNLGIFGPPGSGKSYIVWQIANAANIPKNDVLLFNLSQFKDSAEICGALHRVRDKVLKGGTPFVFWDEFDSGGYKWLQFLLAPMEDGEFQDGQITHPLGNCIFAFAGATASAFGEFGPINPNKLENNVQEKLEKTKKLEPLQDAWKAFVLAKGPDFKSRIVAYLNLLGMNRRQICIEKDGRRKWADDPTDLCFPIRRALFMRSFFGLNSGEKLKMDLNVVRALIEIPFYKGAGRSLQFLYTQLKSAVGQSSGRSSLPSPELLSMHVDADEFWKLCEQDAKFVPKAKDLAKLLHEAYRLRIKNRPDKKNLDVEFSQLPEDMQRANLAQAMRISGILRLAGMHLEPGRKVSLQKLPKSRQKNDGPVRRHLAEKDRKEVLAEAEHNGWMVERMLSGLKYGRKKDEHAKPPTHDCLIPYSQLSDDIKNYDRWTIVGNPAPLGKPHEEQFGYVDIVKTVGLRVVKDKKKPLPSVKV